MARVRQARRCRARRSDGQPCRAYAIVGGAVCRAHGGSAPQVRHAAYVAHAEARAYRAFLAESARWRRECRQWQTERVITTARLLGMPDKDVTTMDIVWCHVEHGRPDLDDVAPRTRRDRRFTMPEPSRAAVRRRDPSSPAARDGSAGG